MIFALLLLLCVGCHPERPPPIYEVVEIAGRDRGAPLYRARLPEGWERESPAPTGSLEDTTKPLAEFYLRKAEGTIRITFHNFPYDTPDQQIAPMSQVARWARQFEHLDPAASVVTPQVFSGFVGYLFEGTGRLNNETKSMLAWAMQLAPEHAQHLQEERYRQMRAAFTLKAVGPSALMAKEKPAIMAFARSFELIDELPR